jgi:hypothetical protein
MMMTTTPWTEIKASTKLNNENVTVITNGSRPNIYLKIGKKGN